MRRLLGALTALSLWASPPSESVVRVLARPGCLDRVVGSGVVLLPGVVVTNAHVVQGSVDVEVRQDGRSYRVQAHILAPELDLCLLRVPVLPTPPAEVARRPPQIGEALEAWGFPGGRTDVPLRTLGTLKATWSYRRDQLLQVEARIEGGQSGGGLFRADGQLLGITTFNLLGAGNTHFAVPATWAEGLLARPWTEGVAIPVCKPRTVLMHELLDRLTEDPANRPPWEAFARAWVAERPRDAEAWYALGHVLLARYLDQARSGTTDPSLQGAFLEAAERAVQLDPTHVRAWNNLGVAHQELGEAQQSRRAFGMAVRIKPDYGLAWINLAAPLVDLQAYPEAVAALTRGLALVPDHAEGWGRLGFLEQRLGRLPSAEANLRRALRYRPFHVPWLLELAEVLWRRRDVAGLEAVRQQLEARGPEALSQLKLRQQGWRRTP